MIPDSHAKGKSGGATFPVFPGALLGLDNRDLYS